MGSKEAFDRFTNIFNDRVNEVQGRQFKGRRDACQVSQEQVGESFGESQADSIHGHGGEIVDDQFGVEGQIR